MIVIVRKLDSTQEVVPQPPGTIPAGEDGGAPSDVPRRVRTTQFVAVRQAGNGPHDLVLVRRKGTLYGFQPNAVRHGLIQADWTSDSTIPDGRHVFLRTRTTIVKLRWRALPTAMAGIRGLPLARANHGVFVNLNAIEILDFQGATKRVGFLIPQAGRPPKSEWVIVSEMCAREILRRLR